MGRYYDIYSGNFHNHRVVHTECGISKAFFRCPSDDLLIERTDIRVITPSYPVNIDPTYLTTTIHMRRALAIEFCHYYSLLLLSLSKAMRENMILESIYFRALDITKIRSLDPLERHSLKNAVCLACL